MTETPRPSISARSSGGQLVINVVANYGYYVVGILVMLILSPFLNNHLGQKIFGDWIFLMGLTVYFSLADAGLNAATVKYVAQHVARGDWTAAGQTMAASLRFFLGLGLLFLVLAVGVAVSPDSLVFPEIILKYLKLMSRETGLTILCILLLNWAVELGFAPFNAALFGVQRYELARSVAIIARLAKFAAILILISKGYGVVVLAIVTCGEALLRGGIQWFLVRRYIPELPIQLAGARRETYRMFFRFSVWILLSNLAYKLFMLSDIILIQITRGEDAEVVMYNTAVMAPIINMEQMLWALAQVLVPFAAAGAALARNRTLRESILRGSRFTLLLALPMIVYLCLAWRGFVGAWMFNETEFPADHVAQSQNLLMILAPAFLLLFIQQPAIAVLVGMGRIRMPAFINLGQGVLKIVLSLILVKYMGLAGIALGTAIPLVLFNGFVLPWYVKRVLDIRWHHLLLQVAYPGFKTLLIAGPLAMVFLWGVNAVDQAFWRLRFQIPIALGVAAIFLLVSWFLGLDRKDRTWALSRLPFLKRK